MDTSWHLLLLLLGLQVGATWGALKMTPQTETLARFNSSGDSVTPLIADCAVRKPTATDVLEIQISRTTIHPMHIHVVASASTRKRKRYAVANLGVPGMSRANVTGGINLDSPNDSYVTVILHHLTCQDSGMYMCTVYYRTTFDNDTVTNHIDHDNATLIVRETPSVTIAEAEPNDERHVYKSGTTLTVKCMAFVGSNNFTWKWEERITGVPGTALDKGDFQKVTDGTQQTLPVETMFYCRRLSGSSLTVNVTRHRQFLCYVITPDGNFRHLGATYSVFVGAKPPTYTLPDRELNPPTMVGTVNFEHRWNLTDVDDFDLDVDVSLYLVLGGQMSAMMFFWGAALSLIIWIHMQHTYSYARTHASFYDRCGVDRAWGPGHAYLK